MFLFVWYGVYVGFKVVSDHRRVRGVTAPDWLPLRAPPALHNAFKDVFPLLCYDVMTTSLPTVAYRITSPYNSNGFVYGQNPSLFAKASLFLCGVNFYAYVRLKYTGWRKTAIGANVQGAAEIDVSMGEDGAGDAQASESEKGYTVKGGGAAEAVSTSGRTSSLDRFLLLLGDDDTKKVGTTPVRSAVLFSLCTLIFRSGICES